MNNCNENKYNKASDNWFFKYTKDKTFNSHLYKCFEKKTVPNLEIELQKYRNSSVIQNFTHSLFKNCSKNKTINQYKKKLSYIYYYFDLIPKNQKWSQYGWIHDDYADGHFPHCLQLPHYFHEYWKEHKMVPLLKKIIPTPKDFVPDYLTSRQIESENLNPTIRTYQFPKNLFLNKIFSNFLNLSNKEQVLLFSKIQNYLLKELSFREKNIKNIKYLLKNLKPGFTFYYDDMELVFMGFFYNGYIPVRLIYLEEKHIYYENIFFIGQQIRHYSGSFLDEEDKRYFIFEYKKKQKDWIFTSFIGKPYNQHFPYSIYTYRNILSHSLGVPLICKLREKMLLFLNLPEDTIDLILSFYCR